MFYDNLKEICDKNNVKITPVVAECGGAKGSISNWKKGASPNSDIIARLSVRLNVSTDYLIFGKDNISNLPEDELELLTYYNALPEVEKIRLVSRAEAIADVYAEQVRKQKEETQIMMSSGQLDQSLSTITLHYFEDAASAGKGVELGDGKYEDLTVFNNAFTSKSDIVIRVNGDSMEPQFHNNDLVLVRLTPCVDEGEIGIFRIGNSKGFIKKRGSDRLISLNPDYDDILFSETDDISTIGRVIGVLQSDWIVK